MATVSKWNPFGVALDITATGSTVTRTAANKYTVKINASWETYYSGGKTNYGMTASSGGGSATINKFGTSASSGSGSFTGTYSISGNGSATQTITVTFKNFNTDNGDSATKTVSFNVTVPAWTSYTISYNANGGAGAPSNQTKWKDQTLTLSTAKPTRTGYSFLGWATSSTATSATYAAGASYTANAAATLYAVWKANTYTVSYNANGGTGAPANQTKTYDKALTLSSTIPTRENYNFLGWGTSASATTVTYAAGASYTGNAALTLYAIWELAYTNPRITNFTVERYDSTSALVNFTWACDQPLTSILINWAGWDGSFGGQKILMPNEATNPVSVVVGDSTLNPEMSYEFQVVVVDSGGRSEATKTLDTEAFIIDYAPNGVAFGKAAELENTAEFAYDAKFNGAVYGRVLGLDRLPAIPESSDFNDYITTGCYAVQSNTVAASCGNIPVARAGRLEVWAATGEGVRDEQWSYLRQRFIPYNSENAVWERDITRGEDNVWRFFEWYRSSLTPNASNKIYNKSAITVCLTANITSLTTGEYTKIAFDKTLSTMGNNLELGINSIIIGADIGYVKASAQILLKCLARGSKHFKINKTSANGTTTSYAWVCQEVDPITNTSGTVQATGIEFCLPPIIIPVKENDLITCTYYTSNSTDYIVAGSTAGGAQSYFTVEEI